MVYANIANNKVSSILKPFAQALPAGWPLSPAHTSPALVVTIDLLVFKKVPQHSLPLRSRNPRPTLATHLYIHLTCEVPSDGCDDDSNADKAHRYRERSLIAWREARIKQLGTNRAADLAITVCKRDCKSRACCAVDSLHSPRPHHDIPISRVSLHAFWNSTGVLIFIPSSRETSREKSRCVDTSDVRVGVFNCVACLNCDHKNQGNRWEWNRGCAC